MEKNASLSFSCRFELFQGFRRDPESDHRFLISTFFVNDCHFSILFKRLFRGIIIRYDQYGNCPFGFPEMFISCLLPRMNISTDNYIILHNCFFFQRVLTYGQKLIGQLRLFSYKRYNGCPARIREQ